MGQEDYKIQLEVFEGPLDLLLHLIKKDDLDIYNIPISKLLMQYLEYIHLAKELDIDLAGEFLEMAAELAYIKSRMLLPEPETEAEEVPDPRAELVARLLEYQKYKMAAQSLWKKPLLGRDIFTRPAPPKTGEENETFIEADSLSLLTAFNELLKKLPSAQVHEVQQMRLGVAERMLELLEQLKDKKQVDFIDLFEGKTTRGELVVTFLAILEMAKQHLIRIFQEPIFKKIYLCPLMATEESPPEESQAKQEEEVHGT
jgi:segregation and condensation protein A